MPQTSPAPTQAATPRQRRKEDRPQELLDAALELFGEKGFAATRSEEVALRAGVSKGTLYLYFPSKEELLKAVIRDRLSTQIAAGGERAASFEGPASEVLLEVLTDWWRAVFDSPVSAVFKIIITEVRNFPEIAEFYHQEVIKPGQRLIGQILQRGMETGEFRRVDVPSTVLSLVFPMVMLCVHKHSVGACLAMPEIDPRKFIFEHVDLVVSGLLTQPRTKRAATQNLESASFVDKSTTRSA